jgi:hypothetical protein
MMEWLTDSVLGKAADWVLDKVASLGKRANARDTLICGDLIGGQSAQGRVAAAIDQLLREPLLPSAVTLVEATRAWLSGAATRTALTQYLLARLGGNDALATVAFEALADEYANATGEAAQLARGPVEAVANYVAALISDDPVFLASQVAELAADNRERRMAQLAPPNLEGLAAAARGLLEQAPKAARLLEQRIPCAFEMGEQPGSRERLDVTTLKGLLHERKLVVIAGEGGSGKTTALIELGHAFLAESGMPVPLYVSALSWLHTDQPLLRYMASMAGVRRAAIDEETLSRLLINGRVVLLLNGWNEIAAGDKGRAAACADDFLGGHPGVLVVCTSRRAEGPFAASGGAVVTMLEFNWERQRALITQALPGNAGDGLLHRLQTDTPLRLTARNPLVLSSAILLAHKGRAVPATMYDLLEAVEPILEAVTQRQLALDGAPLWGQHRAYLKALARGLTASGNVDMSLDEARMVVGSVIAALQRSGQVQRQDVKPFEVVDALCDTHLLHRDRDSETLRFSHQRFQEFFAAKWVLDQLSADGQTDEQLRSLAKDVFNWPAWTEALDLVAEKLATGNLPEARTRMVAVALRADLTLASRLAGVLRMDSTERGPCAQLVEGIAQLHAATSSGAKRHALACMALTRSPVFSRELTALVEAGELQETLGVVHNVAGLSVRSFGESVTSRFRSWPAEQRRILVQCLGSHPENLVFLSDVAGRDAEPSVSAQAIATLAWEYPASDAALDAWFAAPDDAKLTHEAFNAVLYLASDERMPQLLSEVQRLAVFTGNKNLLLQLARERPMEERGFAVEAAKEALRQSDRNRSSSDEVVQLVAKFNADGLQTIAEEQLLKHRNAPDWVATHLQSLSSDQQRAAFSRVFAVVRDGNEYTVDGERIGGLAGADEVAEVLGEWLDLTLADPALRNRERFLSRILSATDTSDLAAAVLARKAHSTYPQARRMLELLVRPRFVERSSDRADEQQRVLPPETAQSLVEAYWDLAEPTAPHSDGVRAALCILLSRSDSVRFIDRIFDGLKLEAARRAALMTQRRPASGMSYGDEFARSAMACGAAMARRLLPLLDTHDESNVLLGVVQQIAIQTWPRNSFHARLDIAARKQRINEGFVLRQRDKEMQEITDELASKIASRLEACGDATVSPQENRFDRRWWLMTSLANLPTRVGWAELRKSLLRTDALTDRFTYALNAWISQGATIEDAGVVAALRRKFTERVESTEGFDQHDTSLEDLAALHFFVTDAALSLEDLDSTVDQWVAKAQSYVVVRKLREIGTPAAIAQLTRLSKQGAFPRTDEALHALMVNAHGPKMLLEMAEDGSLFKLSRGYINVRQVASALAPLVRGDPSSLHKVLDACARQNTGTAEVLAFELLSALPSPDIKALDYLLEFVDRAGRSGRARVGSSFEGLFEASESIEDSPNSQHLYPRACNHIRTALFEMAMASGPASAIAAELLFDIEGRRFSLGRPLDEPRHPNIEAEYWWPQCLATAS